MTGAQCTTVAFIPDGLSDETIEAFLQLLEAVFDPLPVRVRPMDHSPSTAARINVEGPAAAVLSALQAATIWLRATADVEPHHEWRRIHTHHPAERYL